jgi:hypothetical protein
MYDILIAGSLLFGPSVPIPPDPPPSPVEIAIDDFINSAPDFFSVPSGTIPWGIPTMPVVTVDLDIDDPSFDEVTHSAEYNANIGDMEAQFDLVDAPISDSETGIGAWIGETGALPDASGAGDFDIEIDTPGYEDITAYEVAAELGDNLGTLFGWMRALPEIEVEMGGAVAIFGFILLCICWMLLVTFFKFALQFADALFSVIGRLIELIPVAE